MNDEMQTTMNSEIHKTYRSIFISDFHLGTAGCQAELILDFLRRTDSEYLYLVGDIIDGWRLKQRWWWPQKHNDVLQKLLRKARKGTRVKCIPGNHDEFARDYDGLEFGGIKIENSTFHETLKGLRILIVHGDEFDGVVRYSKTLSMLGGWAYDMAIIFNGWLNFVRRRFGLSQWSLAGYLKRQVKEAMKYITSFEEAAANHAKLNGADAILCGHIHHASMNKVDDVLYLNDGDWVESGTALVEELDGSITILKWKLSDEPEILYSSNSLTS